MKTVKTTCPYCGVGCGVLATAGVEDEPHALKIEGDPDHPANVGRLCVKGAALAETVGLEGRLLHPEISVPSPLAGEGEGGRVGRQRKQAGWNEALDYVAESFTRTIAEHGPESVAFYVSGQLLTEDYYVANKLMKGYIGTANIDTNSRLCMSSAVAGHKRAFGEDIVPVSYADFDVADLVVLVGSNTAWCHPVLYQRIAKAKETRPAMKVVVIDPRATATCDIADLHLPLKPGTDVLLFNGLLAHLRRSGATNTRFVARHTRGANSALAVADSTAGEITSVARRCGVDAGRLEQFYRWFAQTERVITLFSQGVNQSSSGTDKVNAIINCHLLTGRIGQPGAGPFSVTGQPNAMGGREVGGLASTLAAHLDFEPGHRRLVQSFWNSPRIAKKPGLKAVDLFEAIHAGKVKAVWIMATNPVVSLPDADRVRAALARCERVVVSDVTADTDTARLAHIVLPAAAWGEKDGTVTNSDRHISRSRAFLTPPGEARPDWWIVCEVAKRMGFADGFNFSSAHEIFDEHARLSAFRNAEIPPNPPLIKGGGDAGGFIGRAFNIGGLAGLTRERYDSLKPVRWPVYADGGDGRADGSVSFEYLSPSPESRVPSPVFYHPDGKARFIPTDPRPPAHSPDDEFSLVLNTGRIRDQWHTMTRTGKSPRLSAHRPEPFVDVHPQDALACGARDGELARVSTRWGAMVARCRFSDEVPRGMLFVPIHWNGEFASDARVGALVNPVVDPVSGEPEFKHTPARLEPFVVDWHGFVLTRDPGYLSGLLSRVPDPGSRVPVFWVRVTGQQFTRYELAGRGPIRDYETWARGLLGADVAGADWLEYSDRSAGVYRAARVEEARIESCVFVSPRPDLPSRAWLAGLFGKPGLEDVDRASLLLGEPINRDADTGPLVCSCFGIGRNTILDAVKARQLKTPAQVGECLKAGTNCGSCVPELRALLQEAAPALSS